MDEGAFMRLAIARCRAGIEAGQAPFGSVIVRDARPIAESHNTVCRDGDPTAHAEVNCIRDAARILRTIDLRGGTLYATCEPCPMCLAACHWAKLDRVVFGASIADARAAGFSELPVAAADLARLGRSPLRVEGGLLVQDCAALFEEWRRAGRSGAY